MSSEYRTRITSDPSLLTPGFHHGVLDPQTAFRAGLEAMSRPGLVVAVGVTVQPPAPLNVATAALALTLFDADTPVWLDRNADTPAVQTFLRFHCGCPLAKDTGAAAFALITEAGSLPELMAFDIGDEQYPDRSCTVFVQLPALEGGHTATLTGPGVKDELTVAPQGLPEDFARRWAANHTLFPQGIDLYLTCGDNVLGLPRSVRWRI